MSSKFYFCHGSYLLSRTTNLLIDKENRVIGVLAGQPTQPSWTMACNNAAAVLGRLAEWAVPSAKDIESRRGIFPTIAYGVSLGNGQTVSAALVLFALYPMY